jgi:nicotinate (nicotinamide) nucleotide adenylyltransferase
MVYYAVLNTSKLATLDFSHNFGDGGSVWTPTTTNVAIYGLTADPPHVAHQQVVNAVLSSNMFRYIHVCSSEQNPLKATTETPYAHRLQMCELLWKDQSSCVKVHDRPYTRTVELLEQLGVTSPVKKSSIKFRYWIVVGSDCLINIASWYRINDIMAYCDILVHERPGFEVAKMVEYIPDNIFARMTVLTHSQITDISSTKLREWLANKNTRQLKKYLDPRVFDYIKVNHLYGY